MSDIGTVTVQPLTVLAGVNGAGKSHLLQAIKEGAVRAYIDDYMLDTNEIALYDWTDFAVQTPPTATNWQIGQKRDQLWKTIQNQLRNGKAGQRIKSHPDRLGQHFTNEQLLHTPIDDLELTEDLANAVDDERREIRKELLSALNPHHSALIKSIERFTKRLIVELKKEDFADAATMVAQNTDPLQLQVSDLFLAYQSALDKNDLRRLKSMHESADTRYLTDKDFKTLYGPPPWDMLNSLLADLGLDFEVDRPSPTQESCDVTLVQRTSRTEVPFADLSSGEKVLMALAMSLYGSVESRHRIQLPKLMLLDEIDAPLHPDMTRILNAKII